MKFKQVKKKMIKFTTTKKIVFPFIFYLKFLAQRKKKPSEYHVASQTIFWKGAFSKILLALKDICDKTPAKLLASLASLKRLAVWGKTPTN